MKIEKKQKLTKEWFIELQNLICDSVEQLEKEYGSNIKFIRNKWKHGEYRTIKGKVIEKGGVAFSNVTGKFPKEFAKTIPGTKSSTNFWSSGVRWYFILIVLRFPLCISTLDLSVHKKIGLEVAWM